jgi:hypothetical protein
MASAPVLISAAMLKQAKYVERKGFFVNQLYGTEAVHCMADTDRMRTPEKYAAGKRLKRNHRAFAGWLISRRKGEAAVCMAWGF